MHQKYFFFLSKKEYNICEVQDSCSFAMIMKQSASMQAIHPSQISTGPAAHLDLSLAEVWHLYPLLILTVSSLLFYYQVELQETKPSFFLCPEPTISTESYAHSLLSL